MPQELRIHLFVLAVSVGMVSSPVSRAHDGHSGDHFHPGDDLLKVWSGLDGEPICEGSLAAVRDGDLIVQDHDGRFVSIEVNQLSDADRLLTEGRQKLAQELNTQPIIRVANRSGKLATSHSPSLGLMQRAFGAFAPKVKTRWDARYFYVESNSIPAHGMMVGIRAWQQQVPIPQPYTGSNSWQIPLHPSPARQPLSTKRHFFRGAIALAVNGVPIFNPIKNDGCTDTVVAGELDRWGGHCGRADDYHYHIAPTHLQVRVGPGNPIAFALDGYPIYGFTEPDGSAVRPLDWMNGHTDEQGNYHYHATKTYPYLVGGFRGEVREVGGQVDPQPRPRGIRPATRPLRGATITGFEGDLQAGYRLAFRQNGRDGFVNYRLLDGGRVTFQIIDIAGRKTSATFEPRQRGGGTGNRARRRPPR